MTQPNDLVNCPSCGEGVKYGLLNSHLDMCLQRPSTRNPESADRPSEQSGRSAINKGIFGPMMQSAKKRKAGVLNVAGFSDVTRPAGVPHAGVAQAQHTTVSKGDIHSTRPKAPKLPQKDHASRMKQRLSEVAPLAERLRPRSMDEYVGQDHIVKKGPLAALLKQGKLPSMILWGPPGTGKTSLARLLAKAANENFASREQMQEHGRTLQTSGSSQQPETSFRFVEISATTAGTAEVKRIFEEALSCLQITGQRTVLLIDEVQRFSRAQQDIFLPVVERGHIILIAATTENPSFRLQGALLSRMRVFVLEKLTSESCLEILRQARTRAVELGYGSKQTSPIVREGSSDGVNVTLNSAVSDGILEYIAQSCDGDARSALQSLEVALATVDPEKSDTDNLNELRVALKRQAFLYDRSGEQHYNTISALHKSIRGSNADAALYWLARMVSCGDDPLFIARRLIVAASEDCDGNLAALQMATSTYQACQVVGLPECGENLAQCVVYLAESPKSTRSYKAWKKALRLVESEQAYPVPLHIRNAPTKLMIDLSYGKEYRYEPSYCHPIAQDFFPEGLGQEIRFLSPPPGDVVSAKASSNFRVSPSSPTQQLADGSQRLAAADRSAAAITATHATTTIEKVRFLSPADGSGPGACQRVFDIGSRVVDLDLLDEWQAKKNGGKRWAGRDDLEAKLLLEGRPREP